MRHNIYHGGRVQSLGYDAGSGYTTVGVIGPGSHSFVTDAQEHVEILDGVLEVRLPGEDWRPVASGQGYEVPGGVTFEVRASGEVAYLCRFG